MVQENLAILFSQASHIREIRKINLTLLAPRNAQELSTYVIINAVVSNLA